MKEEFIILLYGASYLLFFALLLFSSIHKANRLIYKNEFAHNLILVLILHIAGIFLFGVFPYFSNHSLLINFFDWPQMKIWSTWVVIILALIVLTVSPALANKEYKLNRHQFGTKTFLSRTFIIFYFFFRVLFIAAYETWFRGFLLNDSVEAFGTLPAIVLNVGLYSILHLVNGKKEVLSCIPFGLLLCCLCIWQGSPLPAIVIHLALTISYEVSMVRQVNSTVPL